MKNWESGSARSLITSLRSTSTNTSYQEIQLESITLKRLLTRTCTSWQQNILSLLGLLNSTLTCRVFSIKNLNCKTIHNSKHSLSISLWIQLIFPLFLRQELWLLRNSSCLFFSSTTHLSTSSLMMWRKCTWESWKLTLAVQIRISLPYLKTLTSCWLSQLCQWRRIRTSSDKSTTTWKNLQD